MTINSRGTAHSCCKPINELLQCQSRMFIAAKASRRTSVHNVNVTLSYTFRNGNSIPSSYQFSAGIGRAAKSSGVTGLCSCIEKQRTWCEKKMRMQKTDRCFQWPLEKYEILTASDTVNQCNDRKHVSSWEGRESWFQNAKLENLALASHTLLSLSELFLAMTKPGKHIIHFLQISEVADWWYDKNKY